MVHLLTNVAEYAIIINEKKKEFLLVQWDEEFDFSWHFPGGRLDENDEEIKGLIREIDEELNVEVENIKPVYSKFVTNKLLGTNKYMHRFALFYLAKLKNNSEIKLNEEELHSYKWFKKEDLPKIKFWLPFYKAMLEEVLPF